MLDCLEELHINHFEYCFLTSDHWFETDSFQVKIPKIMPLIPDGDSKTVSTTFRNTIFVNANECKPQVPSKVTTQNYLTVSKFQNADMQYQVPDYEETGDGYIKRGTKLIAVVMDGNIKDIYMTNSI